MQRDGCEGFYEPLEQILKKEGGVIFFDGLDEVLHQENDPRRTRIKEAIRVFAEPLDNCRVIVTSRECAYNKSEEWRLPADKYPAVMLDGFNLDQVQAFTELWYGFIGPRKGWSEDKQRKDADDLYQAVKTQSHLRELAEYPLLLTLMAQVHGAIGYLPESRADLYDRAVNLLLAHWDNRIIRETDGAVNVQKGLIMRLGVRIETLRAALERVAFAAHETQERNENRSDRCADILWQDLMAELRKELKSEDKAKTVIEYIHERAGLLHALEEFKTYAFPHRTFQEFLAAVHIMKKSDFHTMLRDRVRRDMVWWREVFLLGAGHYRKAPMYVSTMVSALVPKGLAEQTAAVPSEKAPIVQLCAQALAETDFVRHVETEREDEAGVYSATYERIQNWLVSSLVSDETLDAKTRVESGRLLGRIGDPREVVTTLAHMEFCLVPDGAFVMGDGKDRHPNDCLDYDYWISRYPITNAQFEVFVKADGYLEWRFWKVAEEAGFWNESGFKGKYDDNRRSRPVEYVFPFGLSNHPVVGVTWYEALAFTVWLTEIWRRDGIIDKKRHIRLPSEAEWEKAARGGLEISKPPIVAPARGNQWERETTRAANTDPEWKYPWGEEIDKEKANYDKTGIGTTSALGCFPAGASRYSCLEMAGNVWEWTRSADKGYPYQPDDGREELKGIKPRVLRGGAFGLTDGDMRCASRNWYGPYDRARHDGFRVLYAPNSPL